MPCKINIKEYLYKVIYTDILNKNKVIYIFIGELDNDIKKIIKKIESKEKITKKEEKDLEEKYPNDIKYLLKLISSKFKVKFIEDKIRLNDTIKTIRNKIFLFLSNEKTKNFIIPNNQFLWMNNVDDKKILLGFYYDEIDINPKDIYQTKYIEPDNNFVNENGIKIKRNDLVSNNDLIIYDLMKKNNIEQPKIYLYNAQNFEEYLKKKKIEIDINLINGWFLKYWPKYKKFNISQIIENYKHTNEVIKINKYIYSLINSPLKNDNFENCLLTTLKLNTNENKIREFYKKENIKINLFNIFHYLVTQNLINDKMPLVKYKDPSLDNTRTYTWKNIKTLISKDLLKKWVGLKKKGKEWIFKQNTSSLQIKRLYKYIDNNPVFYTLVIWDKGNLTLNISFKETQNASFKDLETVIEDCKKFIDMINKNIILIKNFKKFKLIAPKLTFNNNNLKLDEFTSISYFNSTTPFDIGDLDIQQLSKFVPNFNYFIKLKDPKKPIINTLYLKYIKVSKYADMGEILSFIDDKKEEGMSDDLVIKVVSDEIGTTMDKANEYLKEWKKKYGFTKKKGDINFNSGISVDISNKKFSISGLKDLQQLNSIYKFTTTFIDIFKNLNSYMEDKKFVQILIDKKINNSNIEDFNENEEQNLNESNYGNNYANNFNINNYNNLENYESNEVYFNDEIEEEQNNKDLLLLSDTGKALANDDEIQVNLPIEVVCKDDKIDTKHDTCGDICNDNKYFLRRLQKYDSKLFKYSFDKKTKKRGDEQYSRACQGAKQPLVIDFDPATNENFNPKAYKNVIKYGINEKNQNWYLCPDAWCPYCKIPIAREDFESTFAIKQGINGKCKVAKCPYGDHQIYVRKRDDAKYENYIGFTKAKNPNGFCLPCCGLKDQSNPKSAFYKNYMSCLGQNIENNVEDDEQNIYVLGKTIPVIQNRYGLLPNAVSNLLKSKCEGGYIGNRKCFLRKGIKQSHQQSFLSCIADLLSPNKKDIFTVQMLKKQLISKLTPNLFKSLNNGILEFRFDNPKNNISAYDNFKKIYNVR